MRMIILADIGGTHARFAQQSGQSLSDIKKYQAADFKTLQDALGKYCNDTDIPNGGTLKIATAGYEDDRVWKFVNKNKWVINPADLDAIGWHAEIILNDFEAATYALPHLTDTDQKTLKPAAGASETLCLIGPGTGLGLGLYHQDKKPPVQKTHGGHMPIAAKTDEQWQIVQKLRTNVFEDIVSGPGLQKLRQVTDEKTALRLFHEFFALAAANAVVTSHAYGGLYFTGGVLESLMADNVFDAEYFEECFIFDAVASVKRDLDATPIIYITDPYPALKGLLHA